MIDLKRLFKKAFLWKNVASMDRYPGKTTGTKKSMAKAAEVRKRRVKTRVDIHDIAAKAGVSISTVSRVTNRAANVDPEIAKRVWKVIEKMGYSPSRSAQALGSGRSRLVGLIVPEINNPFFPELIQSFENVTLEHGYEMMLGSTYGDAARTEMWVRRMLQYGVQGIAMMTFGEEPESVYQIADGVPVVNAFCGVDRGPHTCVQEDYASGIRQAVQHLMELGHSRIGFAGAEQSVYTARKRRQAFVDAMEAQGIAVLDEWVMESHDTLEGGAACAQEILRMRERPTAMLCYNDLMAIGMIDALHDAGLRVPRDISVIGYDDITLAHFTSPRLTTVRFSRREIAEKAFSTLRWYFEGMDENGPQSKTISTELCVRESTAAPAF
jgi:LacI family transcriptional regulator